MKTEHLRVDWVDYAKGLGIILVVLGHALVGIKEAHIPTNLFVINSLFTFIYSFHMSLFFALSGFFFEKSLDNHHEKKFLINKLQTILYPFVIWSIIQTAFEVAFSSQTNAKLPIQALYTCLFIPRSVYWFLFALFFINVVNVLIYKVSRKYGLLISCSIWLLIYVFKPHFGSFDKTFYNLIYFNFGILLARNMTYLKFVLENKLCILLTFLLFVGAEFLYFRYGRWTWFNTLDTQVLGTLLVIQLSFYAVKTRSKTVINFLGENSMIIFLSHVLFTAGFRIFLQKILHVDNAIVHIVFNTLVGLCFPLGLKYLSIHQPKFGWLFQYNKSSRQATTKEVAIQ
ncbi:acyltransferase [Mucilaginibacter sp.]|uniref:acyltransferase family protein n=1 Tax=Mucilaginibacter sp. TaxID=1882438 RepID=UPI0025DDD3ED|nr:acyltransferase [Mucilaginibacter sp.]